MTEVPDNSTGGAGRGGAITRGVAPGEGAGDRPANDNKERGDAAIDEWESEGGHFPALPPVGIATAEASPGPPDAAESVALAAMRARFVSDVADGRVGGHHNSYAHRTRVLRQLAAREQSEPGRTPVR